MITVCEVVMTEGAVYNPFDKLPIEGAMDQVTFAVVLPVIVAVNWVLCEGPKFTALGVTETLPVTAGVAEPTRTTVCSDATPSSVATSLPAASKYETLKYALCRGKTGIVIVQEAAQGAGA
jgi:hypothetical protein